MTIEIHGDCDPRFAAVREAFGKNFDAGLEVGASFAAVLDGEPVVDLWAGDADARRRPWERDTIVNVFSTTKMMAAITTLMAVDRRQLDLDAPVMSIWPEFGAAGKEAVLVRHILSHASGVPGWDEKIDVDVLFDWDRTCALLAAQAPWWEPGTASGYHALTHGFLLGEVVRRATGRTLGTFFREEVAEPLGADFHIGLAPEHDARVGSLIPSTEPLGAAAAPDSIAARTLGSPPLVGNIGDREAWRRAEIPAANGQGNARAVARVAGAVACERELDGIRLLSDATLARALEEQSNGMDLVLGVPIRFGCGFGLTSPEMPIGPNPRAFFWGGWGGSLVVIDPDAKLGLSYVMNKMGPGTLGDTRAFGPTAAVYGALATL
jgi:CubicO group peptidase (beta-lactamase class C family)